MPDEPPKVLVFSSCAWCHQRGQMIVELEPVFTGSGKSRPRCHDREACRDRSLLKHNRLAVMFG